MQSNLQNVYNNNFSLHSENHSATDFHGISVETELEMIFSVCDSVFHDFQAWKTSWEKWEIFLSASFPIELVLLMLIPGSEEIVWMLKMMLFWLSFINNFYFITKF